MVTEKEVRNALRNVVSLKARNNIVDLGLIRDITIEDNNVHVKMGFLSCPFTFVLAVRAEDEIKKLEGVKNVEVEVLL